MTTITEAEFSRIVNGIVDDRDSIIEHNPIGTNEEILSWMLLSCLIHYLSLDEMETPCFTGVPDAKTYRDAIVFILKDRRDREFEIGRYLDALTAK